MSMRLVSVLGVAAAVLVLAALVMVVELGRFWGSPRPGAGEFGNQGHRTTFRFVSFRWV